MAIQAARLALPEDNDESLAVLADIDPGAAIGEQLRELRLVKNLTLREVAGVRYSAQPSLAPLYDPSSARIKV